MPAKISTDASITIRFGREILSILSRHDVAKILDEFSDKYLIALEQKGDEDTQHYQIAAILRSPTDISDGFKKKFCNRVWDVLAFQPSPEQLKHAIDCRSHHEIKGHFGYCLKQDREAWQLGLDHKWLEEAQELYAQRLDESKKRIPISKSGFIPKLREMYDELWKILASDSVRYDKFRLLDNCKKYKVLEKMIITQGYDVSCISPYQVKNVIANFDEYIVGYAENSITFSDCLDSVLSEK